MRGVRGGGSLETLRSLIQGHSGCASVSFCFSPSLPLSLYARFSLGYYLSHDLENAAMLQNVLSNITMSGARSCLI